MEDICDRVYIQSSVRSAHEYGLVLLKTLKLLRFDSEGRPPAVTYVGEREFEDMKRRMGEISSFRPYRKKLCIGVAAIASLMIAVMLLVIHTHSYAKCNKDENILVYEYDSEAFEDFLDKNNATGDIFIVFGDFYKLPSFSSGRESCLYETGSDAGVVQIPYQRQISDWMAVLFKIL